MPGSDSLVRKMHTLSEILSQPAVWRTSLEELRSSSAFGQVLENAASRKEWLFVGCGTSFYLAEAAASAWTLLTRETARAVPASEVLLFPELAYRPSAQLQAVVISRSGRTSEALRAAQVFAEDKIPTLGITCVRDSMLSRVCDVTFALPSADENSMVMTRSFNSMLLALLHLAASRSSGCTLTDSVEAVANSVAARIHIFNERVEAFAAGHSFADYVFLAQGPFFPIAREAALKVTEMSCSYAQAYHTLEFRHGPKSIVAPDTCLTFFISATGMQAEAEVLAEMKELGGATIAVCNRASDAVRQSADLLFEFDVSTEELALLAPFIIPAQLLGFHTGVRRGFNPDEPRNLSRVVILD
jgi:glucosamine--fructose-6-phosphate aminotransferase (isomerizing)